MKRIVKLDKIYISKGFRETVPSERKLDKHREIFKKTGSCGGIVVNENGVLLDGYVRYLVLKENNVDVVRVDMIRTSLAKYKKEMEIKRKQEAAKKRELEAKKNIVRYVYGIHPNSVNGREYAWVMDSEHSQKFIVKVGDLIMCKTKYGNAPVVVTKVEVLDHPKDNKEYNYVLYKITKPKVKEESVAV